MNPLQPIGARTGQAWGEPLPTSTPAEVDAAARAAEAAFAQWSGCTGAQRGQLLRALADVLEADRDPLVHLADDETALGPVRLQGELDRTAFQLRRFATLAEQGVPFGVLDDPAVPGAPPAGHPAMARWRVPLGPVAMFAASNFPFAFSVLGGDTASALAAGCPVVVRAHPAHPLLSIQVHERIQRVLTQQGLPPGLVGLVQGAGHEVGVRLIQHPAIAAAAFTGSTRGGAALQAHAQARPRPIPFYGELGSINPVVAMPAILSANGPALAHSLAASITLGCGQFCTSPGVIVLFRGAASEAFAADLRAALATQQPHAMLTPAMRRAFDHGVAHWWEAGAQALLNEPGTDQAPRPCLAQVSAAQFIADATLREEVFGPACLIVWVDSVEQALAVLHAVGGSLTVTLWGADTDTDDSRALVRGAMSIAGRVLFAGVPTGVAVTAAQQHGGPWPSSTQALTTSVGDAAIDRFLRPVALQDAPPWLIARQGRPL